MPTQVTTPPFGELFTKLAEPFSSREIKVRSQSGRQLEYVTARTVMNRLDDVVGPANWWDEYTPLEHSVLCRLSIKLPDGTIVTKSDAGGYAGLADSGDDDKAGFSDAFKRAAVKFGIGRHLYGDGLPRFVVEALGNSPAAQTRPEPPRQPSSNGHNGHSGSGSAPAQAQNPSRTNSQPPRTGKALFAWTKDQEQRYEVGLLKYLNSWAKLHDFPGRMVDWDADQVAQAHAEACRKLSAIQVDRPEDYDEVIAN